MSANVGGRRSTPVDDEHRRQKRNEFDPQKDKDFKLN